MNLDRRSDKVIQQEMGWFHLVACRVKGISEAVGRRTGTDGE